MDFLLFTFLLITDRSSQKDTGLTHCQFAATVEEIDDEEAGLSQPGEFNLQDS